MDALTWGPNDQHRLLNKPITRVDGPPKATGKAVYTYDVKPPGMLFGKVLRSPYAHAKVTSFDASAALKIDGVKGVVQSSTEPRYEGQPVAAVAATTAEIAEDAIRAIAIKYDVLPSVVTVDDALKPDAPQVVRDPNVRRNDKSGDADATNAALAKCDVTIDVEYRTARMHHSCLETHGIVVDYHGGDSATVYASTQGTFSIPGDAAQQLGLQQSNVTAIVQNMGGGFGSKFGIGIAGQLACMLSKQLKVPVKMMLSRADEFLAGGNGPGSLQKVKAGATKDGTLEAIVATQYSLGGIGRGSLSGLPYLYGASHIYRELSAVHTNEDASVAMRAPGHPQASFVMESIMEELADKLGMDPVEFRKKNLNGKTDDAYHRQLDRGAKEIDWTRRNPTPGGGPGPVKRGLGCGIGAWGGGGRAQCIVDLVIGKDGSVVVSNGTQDLGTGTRTYVRAIVAEELGLEMGDVREEIGSSKLGNANGSGGSTTAASLSPAVKDAASKARNSFAERVAPLLGAQPADVTFADGKVSGNGKTLSWKEACAALPAAGLASRGEWQTGLSGNGVHGVCFAEVEVDVETGYIRPVKMVHVQDAGLPLNRLALFSQINGGMIQGLGMALYEGRVMDPKLGIMVNPEFGSYKLPGSLEMPELIPIIDDEDKRPVVIGIAESTNVAACGAIANAVFNACGLRVRELPITPDKILMGLMQKGSA